MPAKEVFDLVEELTEAFRSLSLNDRPSLDIGQELRCIPASGTPRTKKDIPPGFTEGKEASKSLLLSVTRYPTPPPSPKAERKETLRGLSFDQLPSDILYHLFLLVRTADPDESLRRMVTISHVCSSWRDIVTGAPLLWTYIRLTWQDSQQRHFHIFNKLLDRSQRLPMTLRLVVNHLPGMKISLSHWIRLISGYTHRICTLILTLHPTVDYESAVRVLVSPLKMPSLVRFYLEVTDFNRMRCSISLKPREQVDGYQYSPVMPRYRRTPYFDWTARLFHITSLSMKSVLVMARDLFPILVISQTTMTDLEYYVSNCHPDWEDDMPRITLPKLTTLRVGYGCVKPAYLFLRCLTLPSLSSLSMHDFRRCSESGMPALVPVNITPDRTDALTLLQVVHSFTTIAHLTLRGVECFSSSLEEVTSPLQNILHGLKSLVLVNCDAQFMHILYSITLSSSRQDLENLSELAITCYNRSMVLDYFRSRQARDLPRLKTLSVNSKMASLRHFVKDFVDHFHVRGSPNQIPRLSPPHHPLREPHLKQSNIWVRPLQHLAAPSI